MHASKNIDHQHLHTVTQHNYDKGAVLWKGWAGAEALADSITSKINVNPFRRKMVTVCKQLEQFEQVLV